MEESSRPARRTRPSACPLCPHGTPLVDDARYAHRADAQSSHFVTSPLSLAPRRRLGAYATPLRAGPCGKRVRFIVKKTQKTPLVVTSPCHLRCPRFGLDGAFDMLVCLLFAPASAAGRSSLHPHTSYARPSLSPRSLVSSPTHLSSIYVCLQNGRSSAGSKICRV